MTLPSPESASTPERPVISARDVANHLSQASQTGQTLPADRAEPDDEVWLLDVREPHEFAAGHIDGAVTIPMGQLAARQDELPHDRLIVCVCRSGNRSGMVTEALVRAGYQAANMDGGMLAWAEAHLPYVDAHGGPGQVA